MGIIIDVVTLLVLGTSVYFGYKKGIVEVGFKLFAIVVSIIVSLVLYSPITHFVVDNTQIDEKIEEVIVKNGSAKDENKVEQESSVESYVQNYAKDVAKGTQNAIVGTSARPIAVNIVGIGVMLILFIGIRLALTILKVFTDIITKLPLIKECNETVGLIYGIIRGLFIVYAVLGIVFLVTSMAGFGWINDVIASSFVTKYLYENNIIMMFLKK